MNLHGRKQPFRCIFSSSIRDQRIAGVASPQNPNIAKGQAKLPLINSLFVKRIFNQMKNGHKGTNCCASKSINMQKLNIFLVPQLNHLTDALCLFIFLGVNYILIVQGIKYFNFYSSKENHDTISRLRGSKIIILS